MCLPCDTWLHHCDESKYLHIYNYHSPHIILQHHLLILPTLTHHFHFFLRVYLDWQTLIKLPFLLHGDTYLSLHLLHPRAQIKLLSSFFHSTYLVIYQDYTVWLGIYSLLLKHEIEIWTSQAWTVWLFMNCVISDKLHTIFIIQN